jgi:hypothetical protein
VSVSITGAAHQLVELTFALDATASADCVNDSYDVPQSHFLHPKRAI